MTAEQLNKLSRVIIGGAIRVHSALGPGLLESAYRACLAVELRSLGLHVETEVPLSLVYLGVRTEVAYRLDMVVEREIVVELKAIRKIAPIHEAQALSHIRLGKYRLGLLINFHVRRLKDGITRLVNGL